MCENCEEKFVIPRNPSDGIGWWIGQPIDVRGSFYRINITWIPNFGYNVPILKDLTLEDIIIFDTFTEAMNHLKSIGAIVFAPI